MASIITNKGLSLLSKSYWEGAADIEVGLWRSTYTPNKDHDFLDDASTGELTVGSYARTNLASRTATIDNANDRVDYDGADIDFGILGSGQTIRYAIIFENIGGADSARPIIAVIQLAADVVLDGVTPYKQVWADPIFRAIMA